MKKYYELNQSDILNVQVECEFIGEANGKIYVCGEDLQSPFIEVQSLPAQITNLQDLELKEAKDIKEAELNAICDGMLKIFKSDALGKIHIYDGALEDQINLIGLVLSQNSGFFRCKEDGKEIKENKPHTKEQLAQVYRDGATYKMQTIGDCGILKAHLVNLSDIDEVRALSWGDLERIKNELEKSVNE